VHYHDDDKNFSTTLRRAAPEAETGFVAFDQAVFGDGENRLSVKVRELIAVGVAVTTQCPFCIETHAKNAKAAGASIEEVGEAVMVSAALRAGGSYTHGWLAMKSFKEADEIKEAAS
jgi:AhpD family alkylhydroperoxidase